ncbi:hypothetical protein [Jeotgalibacillus terrae]|uniref:Uncharacterized protein n=1 Tax=Jeotgalibacillus terrae TaxID=587735 RepID=A0ABW5ZH45_9BACL|nr:hypothetical protein [Jeotgalibacillus terrae]MBM7578604.1 hypothetical protein [Jeotgalibacillus terrae]
MKKPLAMTSIVLILAISAWLLFDYFSNSGAFTLGSHSSASQELLDQTSPIYLGYEMQWEGTGTPTLERIELIKRDGTIADTDQAAAFIATKGKIGMLGEQAVEKEELVEVNGFQPENDIHLVIRVDKTKGFAENDIKEMRIIYKKYGVTQYQDLSFGEGIVTDEAAERMK